MNTPAHLIFGAAAFARPDRPRVTTCALLGALAPDLSLYLMVGVSLFVQGIEPRVVFGQLYYSDAWQAVFAVDNSFILWGAACAMAVWARRPAWIALTGAALLHLALDFPLHNHDARMHFWPLSTWVFESPFSYWDRSHHGIAIGWAEYTLSIGLCALLWRRFAGWRMRLGIALLAAAETMSSGIWQFIF